VNPQVDSHARARGRVACIIPARDEAARIAATVAAAATLPGVDVVLVCDDGSADDTGAIAAAAAAGAIVVSHGRNRGKAAAVESGVNALGILEQRDGRPVCGSLVLLDADLAESAANCAPLITPVTGGEVDLTIGVLPPQQTETGEAAGGFGLVMNLARSGIAELTGWIPRAPLSGQRCLTRGAFEVASPLAAGWGIEVGMTIDILKAGLTVREIDLDLRHRATGTNLAGQLHRARQLRDVGRALVARGLVGRRIRELTGPAGVAAGLGGLVGKVTRRARG